MFILTARGHSRPRVASNPETMSRPQWRKCGETANKKTALALNVDSYDCTRVDNPKISPLDWDREPKQDCDEVLVRRSTLHNLQSSQRLRRSRSLSSCFLTGRSCVSPLHAFYANTRLV